MDKLQELKELISPNLKIDYSERTNLVQNIVKEIACDYSYDEFKELIHMNKYSYLVAVDIYLNKPDLKEEELHEIIKYLIDEYNYVSYAIKKCNLENRDYIDLLIDVLENNDKNNYESFEVNRLRKLLFELLNNKDGYYLKKLAYSYKELIEYILIEHKNSDKEIKTRLFNALLNREDIIKYLFTTEKDGITLNNEKIKRSVLDLEIQEYDGTKPLEGPGIYYSVFTRLNLSNDELKEIYERYKDVLFDEEKINYYSNCIIFIDYIDETRKIEFIIKTLENDIFNRAEKIFIYNKFKGFLDNYTDLKDRLDAYMVMQKLIR